MKKNRILCLFLVLLMAFCLCACGEEKQKDPNCYDFGKYELKYKGSCIMYSESGKDALVMKFDFTNNSKETASYGWTIYDKAMQNGVEMESAYVITDIETFASVSDTYFTDIEPGITIEVNLAYELNGTDEVKVTLSDLFDSHSHTITVDPSTLERVENEYYDWGDDWTSGNATTASFTDWWAGDWYGWWFISDATGDYEELEGSWWDTCAKITVYDDMTGYVEIWDEDTSRDYLNGAIDVSFSMEGQGEHGIMVSESGSYMGTTLAPADWVVDPALVEIKDLLVIEGTGEDSNGSYSYSIYLRPWGTLWDDLEEDSLPYRYDWYLSFVEAGAAMPDSFDVTAP